MIQLVYQWEVWTKDNMDFSKQIFFVWDGFNPEILHYNTIACIQNLLKSNKKDFATYLLQLLETNFVKDKIVRISKWIIVIQIVSIRNK